MSLGTPSAVVGGGASTRCQNKNNAVSCCKIPISLIDRVLSARADLRPVVLFGVCGQPKIRAGGHGERDRPIGSA